MRSLRNNFKYILGILSISIGLLFISSPSAAEPGCRNSASSLANAYVRLNPLYAIYYGPLESYVAGNPAAFASGADAVRCAGALSQALLSESFQSYDPNDFRRQQEMNAELGAMGISPGQQQMSLSGQLYMMSLRFARLQRALPPASVGDYGPLYTPMNEIEQAEIFTGQLLQSMLDPGTLNLIRPMIEQMAEIEYKIVTDMAIGVGG